MKCPQRMLCIPKTNVWVFHCTFKINYLKMKKYLYCLLSLFMSWTAVAKEIPTRPSPPVLVNDFAGVLSEEQRNALERKLSKYNDTTSTQIAIVIENSIENDEAFEYSRRIAEGWGIGQKGKNNGLLIYVAVQERKIRIQVGYGLEGTVTDAYAKRIIEEVIKPAFRNQQYYEGLDEATNYLIGALSGQFKGDGGVKKGKLSGRTIFVILIIVFFIIYIFSKRGGGGTNYNSRGGGMDLLTGMLLGSALSGGRGSSYGSFSSGSGSFGGFGGGSFGGGGAGGDW
jgi:uncharacterized protein